MRFGRLVRTRRFALAGCGGTEMAKEKRKSLVQASIISCLVGLSLLCGPVVEAQNGDAAHNSDNGYRYTEQGAVKGADPVAPPAGSNTATGAASNEKVDGPVRLARFAYVSGNVNWRSADTAQWSGAVANMPLREGAQIWVIDGGRAEVQFDDGSVLRIGNGAI